MLEKLFKHLRQLTSFESYPLILSPSPLQYLCAVGLVIPGGASSYLADFKSTEAQPGRNPGPTYVWSSTFNNHGVSAELGGWLLSDGSLSGKQLQHANPVMTTKGTSIAIYQVRMQEGRPGT